MLRFSLIAVLGCLGLTACGSDKGDTAEDEVSLLPKAGDWTVVTTGYTNDDCNAADFLIPPDAITFANVEGSSFAITYYLDNSRIGDGSTTCTHTGDNSFGCEDLYHSTMFSESATISMVGVSTINVTSETSATGAGDLRLECTGGGCDQVAAITSTGRMPCDTTLNWTATID